ncbi:MAG TPA: ROK family protein [Candidatus Jeotgalibaca pullicola]|uniref:ROK family protein n=1 Tax=Jeotgalibaca caeni TaxID=3028623 RepID=UPI001F8987F8|nr:ROK family protein [Jeotgalibaca caeni]MDE1549818.1 ROK family protein [Jeotgalibaca caeni]HJB24471.1 ROK family protein [Candidatus Jeotgalibaca pullicola]
MLVGAIEAGGTKFVCAIGNEKNEIIERVSFPTTTPEETLRSVFNFFDQYSLASIGIGSFGPIDINESSDTYGYILSTPKIPWKNFNFLGAMKERYSIPIGWTTDVNAAALGESKLGAAKGLKNTMYITIGTGIGAGAIVNGELLAGIGHPEMGHLLVRPHDKDGYEGFCPYHGNCLEGMAAGPSINGRLGRAGKDVDVDHEVWGFMSYYIGQALVAYTVILRPERIVLGGGVMNAPGMLEKVKKQFSSLLANYVPIPELDNYLVKPGLGDNAGITGSIILANEVK